MGNWSFDVTDDFTLPDGTSAGVSTSMNSFESVHKNFAMFCKYKNYFAIERGFKQEQ